MSLSTPAWPSELTPHLSILMPAYREQRVIGGLVQDLLRQADQAAEHYPDYRLEIVLASDDLFDYSSILPLDDRLVFCKPAMATGPSLARSRALDKARGKFVVAIDADDTVSDNFIEKVFSATNRHQAFAIKTSYYKASKLIRSLEVTTLTLENFIAYSGSASVVYPRDWMKAYPDVVAEDAVAVVNVMQRAGGSLPVIDAQYNIATHPESFCARLGSQFSRLYADHLQSVDEIATTTGNPKIKGMLHALFEARIRVNDEFEASLKAGEGLDYHEFMVSRNCGSGNLATA